MKLILFFLFFASSLFSLPFSKDLMEGGHSVYLTKDSDETQEWKMRLIEEAEVSLEISTGICLGQVLDDLLHAVHEKLINNQKIKINLLLFKVLDFITEEKRSFLESLRDQYGARLSFLITTASALMSQGDKIYVTEDHTKLMIVDEKYVLLGGTNLVDQLSTSDASTYSLVDTLGTSFLPGASCDMDVVIRGPVAQKLRREFYHMLALFNSQESLDDLNGEFECAETGYFSLPKKGRCKIAFFDENPATAHHAKVFGIIVGPRMQLHTIGNMYEELITNAASSIAIGNMYFFPCASIFSALLNASLRGIQISLITNEVHAKLSLSNSTRSSYAHQNRLNYFPLMTGKQFNFWQIPLAKKAHKNNVEIYEYHMKDVLYHKKVMTVDHLYTVIGSYNLGRKSEDADFEVAVVIESPEIALQMEAILEPVQNLFNKQISSR